MTFADLQIGQKASVQKTFTAAVEVVELREDKKIVKLSTTCTNQNGQQAITGLATVKFDG